MKPASILLLAAAGLSSALPAQSATNNAVQQAHEARSLFGHAIDALAARNLVPLNANTAPVGAPPAVDPKAGKKAAASSVASSAAATDAAATVAPPPAAQTDAASVPPPPPAAQTGSATVAPPPPPAAIQTGVAAGNGTSSDKGKGKGKGNGKDNGKGKGNGKDKGKDKGKGKNGGNKNSNNNGNGALSAAITSALNNLGLDGVLNASSIDKLNVGDQISLLAQIVSLQTMKDLQMVGAQDIVVVLNQGFKSQGLNVVING